MPGAAVGKHDVLRATSDWRLRALWWAATALVVSVGGEPVVLAQAIDCGSATPPSRSEAYLASAVGLDNLSRGEVEAAVTCLRFAFAGLPTSEVIARDLALALSHAGLSDEAVRMFQRARALGDPGGDLARAVLAAERGDKGLALDAARRSGGLEGETVEGVLGQGEALRALGKRLESPGPETPIVRLVLASQAAERGNLGSARALAKAAELSAEAYRDPLLFNAARVLRRRLERETAAQLGVRLGLLGEQIVNPAWAAEGPEIVRDAVGLRGRLEVAGVARLGLVRWQGAVSIDQRLFLTEGEALGEAERFGLAAATSLEVPLADDLWAPSVAIGVRLVDVRADGLERRIASSLEGGPTLKIAISSGWWTELGVYGVWTDFEDAADRDFIRDRVGQRARLAFRYEDLGLTGQVAVTALHDEAEGQAFDALGLSVSGRGELRPTAGLAIYLGLAGVLRRWGPVGDESIIGGADRREELRWSAELGSRLRVAPLTHLLIQNTWVRNDARRGHRYVNNVLSAGLEVDWP